VAVAAVVDGEPRRPVAGRGGGWLQPAVGTRKL